jgi:hypothetical protein
MASPVQLTPFEARFWQVPETQAAPGRHWVRPVAHASPESGMAVHVPESTASPVLPVLQ